MTFLLDVNVLIALIDPAHIDHNGAHDWFETAGHTSWATCPLTENAVLRIIGHTSYPNSPGSPALVVPLLRQMLTLPGHQFWGDDISLIANANVNQARLLNASHVTDTYLLALAKANGGKLATFDRRLVTDAVIDGREALSLISST